MLILVMSRDWAPLSVGLPQLKIVACASSVSNITLEVIQL